MPVSLHVATSFDAAWNDVLLPWFRTVIPRTYAAHAPVVVVTPFRSHSHLLRNKLLACGVSLLGVRFFSPAQLREILLRNSGLTIPLREHLRLLLAIAAGQDSESLVAKAVARDPDHFLRVIDQLNAAGWEPDEIHEPALRAIAGRFAKLARDCGFAFVHEADRDVLNRATQLPPRFSNLLVIGFDGAHWPLWPLLRAAVQFSSEATVILSDLRDEARDLDEIWIGTWEETFGVAEPIGDGGLTALGNQLANIPETEREKKERAEKPIDNVYFLVGRDACEQARAVVALTAKFLAENDCERIGIVFPQSGALPRLVAGFLESAGIAHNDCIAHLTPSVFDDDAWRTWLELQQNPRLKILFRFLRSTEAKIFEKMSILEVEDKLQRAYAEVLIDNIDILREFCARSDDKAAIVAGLEKIQFLPATATFAEFLSQTRKIFTQLGWKQHWNEVERLSRNWTDKMPGQLAKGLYVRWLREILGAPSLIRDDLGAHSYARVHLLRYSEAERQSWSHLIFAGLNEEAWPSFDDESGLIGEHEIDEFNRRNRTLNRQAVKRGRQGEGHWSVREGNTLLLGSIERRQIRQRQLRNLMESAPAGVGATANLYSESFPSRIANPTEFFSRLYFAARGRGVSQQTLQALEEQTRDWLKDWSPVDAQKVDSINVGRTRYAFDARRKLHAAGEYEFALRKPPDQPVTLRVTEWEAAVKSPALVWMKIFLGVEPNDESGDAWATSTGQWVHRWLADSVRSANPSEGLAAPSPGHAEARPSGDGFVELRKVDEIRARMRESARQFQNQISDLCAACARPVPDWWASGWTNALFIGDCLAIKLSDLGNDWTHMAPEWSLGSPTAIPLSEGQSLRARGRIDLILASGERNQSRIGFPDLWVIDYKTGRQRGFNLTELRRYKTKEEKLLKQLVKGRGVQLGLYALAAHSLGANNVRLTLLGLLDELEQQFDLDHVRVQKDFWRELYQMQETGVFGMLGNIYSEFGFSRAYPLATLAIDVDRLQEKWALTHPALATEGGEGI